MIRYMIIAKAKKYKIIDGYCANAGSSMSFLTHITKKFQKKTTNFFGQVYYIQQFTTLELLKASSRGQIIIECVGIVKPKEKGGE
jgi:hypothetical protein